MTVEAQILADSVSKDKKRLITYQLRYPRFIHAEVMTHRVFSRNASSSRAIPIQTVLKAIEADPAIPHRWGTNGKGMQDHGQMTQKGADEALKLWLKARDNATKSVRQMVMLHEIPHKQIVNRLLEPWMHITVVVTASTYTNFFAQRRHKDADPTIQALADVMWEAYKQSTPRVLTAGEWHLPYIMQHEREELEKAENREDKLLDLIKLSVTRCARTSYKMFDANNGGSFKFVPPEQDIALYDKLVGSIPMHASPAEHQATPDTCKVLLEDGKVKRVWDMPELGGNFGPGWIQFRQTLEGQNITEYTGD